jgi:tetratricopeptide (TPR) repeat protein
MDTGAYRDALGVATRLAAARAVRFGSDSLEAARGLDLQLEATIRAVGVASADVVPLAERIVRLKERHLSPTDADLAVSVQNLSTVFTERGEYPRALIEAQRALNIRRLALPKDDPRIADSLDVFALPLIQAGQFVEARQALEESLRIRGQRFPGSASIAMARTEFLEALLNRYAGDYSSAKAASERALGLWRRLDSDHPDIAALVQLQGDLNFLNGDMVGAEARWADALARVRRLLGPEHPSVPRLLNGLGSTAQQSGDLERARSLRDQALGVAGRVLAPCHPQLAILLNDLGNLTLYSGRFEESRAFYARALATSERCLGANHSLTATFVHNAANLAVEMGDLPQAEALHRRALDAWSASLGPEHPYVARGLDSLAEVMTLRGQQREAEAMLERALSIRKKALGPAHPDVAGSLVSLARAKSASNEVPVAIREVQEAVAIYGRGGRPQEPDYLAVALVLLGDLEARQGHNEQARNHFSRAAALRSEMFGAEHPLTAEATARLASADFVAGLTRPAFSSALDAERIGRDHLRFTIRYLPERQALAYAAKRPRGLDLALSISAAAGTPEPQPPSMR